MTVRPLRAVPTGPEEEPGAGVPYSIEAEQCVLGAVMLSSATLAQVRPLLDGSEFYRPAHQVIWQAICALADRGAPTDPLAVGAEIGPRRLAQVGGASYLHTLIARVPAAASGLYYAHMVRDLAYARTVAATGARLTQLAGELTDGADLRAAVAAELAALTAVDARGWPEPAPLSTAPRLPRFPVWCLPDWAGEYAAGVAEVTQTPPDLAGCLALAVLAVAAGGNVQVSTGTWTEPTNLYVLVVLPPGNRKSEVYKAMTAPIRTAERLLVEQARPRIAEAVIARRVAEAEAERTEKAATESGDPALQAEAAAARLTLDTTPVPAEPKLFGGNDSTVEKVASRLADQGGRFAVLAPEGAKLLAIAGGQYSGRADMSVFLSGHAGEEIRIDRMGRPSEVVDAATLTIGICLQPGVLTRLGETPEFREQGLLGRLLISMPESLLGYRDTRPHPVPAHVAAEYERTLTALVLSLRHAGDHARDTDTAIPTLTFTPDAQEAVVGMLEAVEPRLRPGSGDLAHMTDWGGKLVGATVRIAALLHLGKHLHTGWERPIDLATWRDAVQVGEYFTAHAQAAYDTIGADPAVADARAVLAWLHRTGTQRFTARDLMRGLKHRFAKVTDTDPALRVLETHGWIRRLPSPPTAGRGRPAAPAYEAHPAALHDPP